MTATEMTSYSQNGEDRAIVSVFGERVGRFLDLGAWHPKQLSNTRALYELGWSGVIVEPSPTPCLAQLAEYGAHTLTDERITIVHAAIGTERHCAQLYVSDDAVSTTETEQFNRWNKHAKFLGKFYIPQLTLNDIFNQFGGPYDFVNIDVEGKSVDILRELLKTAAYPKCICVEHDGRMVEALQMATAAGYSCIMANGENLVLSRMPE